MISILDIDINITIDIFLQIGIKKIGVQFAEEQTTMIKIVFFKIGHILNIDNLIKQPIIYLGIFQNKCKCLIDSGASVSIISKISVPKNYYIEKYERTIRDLSGQLNILGQISTKIEIGEIKITER